MGDAAVALLLLLVANGAPVLATRLLGDRFDRALDGGRRLADGRRLLGAHKTVRGLLASLLATGAVAPLVDLPVALGVLAGGAAMAGDALSSFLKRRNRLASGDRASVLDQLPETLLPLLVLMLFGDLDLIGLLVAGIAFFVVSAGLSPLLHLLGIRERPY